MATKLELTQTFPADAATVRALQLDPDYIAFRGERTGATSVTADVVSNPDGSARVTVVRVLPAEVPSYAKSMIGDTIRSLWPCAAKMLCGVDTRMKTRSLGCERR